MRRIPKKERLLNRMAYLKTRFGKMVYMLPKFWWLFLRYNNAVHKEERREINERR